ncbi:MAG: VanZ family protein [Coriobacteriaceae bacterium]|nr:VanZ family protein [Coriobacteriaceae bacterium]
MAKRNAYADGYQSDWERAVNGPRGTMHGSAAEPVAQPVAQPAAVPYQPVQRAVPVGSGVPPTPTPIAPRVRLVRGRRKASPVYTVFSWIALLCWAGFIFYMSAHTSSDLAQGVFARVRDYIEYLVWTYYGYVEDPVSPIGHFCEYFIFGALLGNALHCHMPLIPATIIAIACASGYGITDEVHQLYVDGRYFDMEDWKVDTVAASLGSVIASFFFYIFGSRREEHFEEY